MLHCAKRLQEKNIETHVLTEPILLNDSHKTAKKHDRYPSAAIPNPTRIECTYDKINPKQHIQYVIWYKRQKKSTEIE